MGGQNVIQTSFEPTEIMSTYLLAFVVCDFAFIRTEPHADVLVKYRQSHLEYTLHSLLYVGCFLDM